MMNEHEQKRRKTYNILLLILRLVMSAFFVYHIFGDDLSSKLETMTLIKMILFGLYVFGMGLLPIERAALYIETVAVVLLMVIIGEPTLISLFVFPLAMSVVTRVSKLDMVIVPLFLLGMIFFGFGWNPLTFIFSLGLFAFFFIKEYEHIIVSNELKKVHMYASEKNVEIRNLESELLLREKENESLMEVFIRTKSLNEKIDIEELIDEMVNAPKSFFNAEQVAIYLLDEDRYRVLKQTDKNSRYDVQKTLQFSEAEEPIISEKHLRLPIKLDKKPWGVLDIYGRREEVMNGQKISSNFNEDDYATIATYIGQVMFSMKHAKLLIKMEEIAKTDQLTKLANRRYFELQFDYLLKQAKRGYDFALIMLDIDYFKKFNDEYGHQKGDEALIVVSEVLQTYVREMDFVARTGGEEFSILVPNANDKVAEIAERLRKKVSIVPFVKPITISLGIAYYGEDGKDMDSLTKNADKALYAAKDKGRNQVIEYREIRDGE